MQATFQNGVLIPPLSWEEWFLPYLVCILSSIVWWDRVTSPKIKSRRFFLREMVICLLHFYSYGFFFLLLVFLIYFTCWFSQHTSVCEIARLRGGVLSSDQGSGLFMVLSYAWFYSFLFCTCCLSQHASHPQYTGASLSTEIPWKIFSPSGKCLYFSFSCIFFYFYFPTMLACTVPRSSWVLAQESALISLFSCTFLNIFNFSTLIACTVPRSSQVRWVFLIR